MSSFAFGELLEDSGSFLYFHVSMS